MSYGWDGTSNERSHYYRLVRELETILVLTAVDIVFRDNRLFRNAGVIFITISRKSEPVDDLH